jgi:hypothetical protein
MFSVIENRQQNVKIRQKVLHANDAL